jgi:hypothetical protein
VGDPVLIFKLTGEIPEPSSIVLAMLGFAGILMRRRRAG